VPLAERETERGERRGRKRGGERVAEGREGGVNEHLCYSVFAVKGTVMNVHKPLLLPLA
jgi:hypothetical protein